jgi:hypothetical protein
MPIVAPDSESDGGFTTTFSLGGMAQINVPEIPNIGTLGATLAASTGTWNSGLIFSDGYRYLTVAATLSQGGTILITQYVDMAGTIARPPGSAIAMTGATPLIVDIPGATAGVINYPYPFMSFTILISNTTASTALISAFQVLLSGG